MEASGRGWQENGCGGLALERQGHTQQQEEGVSRAAVGHFPQEWGAPRRHGFSSTPQDGWETLRLKGEML